MDETTERLESVLRFHLKHMAPCRDFDNDTIDQTWSKGFDHGYESGRMSLIKDLIGTVRYDQILNEVRNETN